VTVPDQDPCQDAEADGFTEDGFLDGRVRLRQPRDGYRAAIDPVFLAAAVPAADGERALEIGAGAGTAALCLAWRVPGLRISGVEIDPAMVRLAAGNAHLNGVERRVDFMVGDLVRPPARIAPGSFHHVLANPPYLEASAASLSPVAGRADAAIEGRAGGSGARLKDWVRFALAMAREGGTVTLIHRADRLGDLLAALGPGAGGITVFPLWPDHGDGPAKRIIAHARKGSRAPMRFARGLALHEGDGRFTPAAEQVLRGGAALDL
jgi:tRNA1(Val) A37 N6-methylase TrmN6